MFTSKFEKLCNEYRENKRCIEELEAMNDGIKNDIIALMGGNDTMIEGAAKVTNKTVNSTRFNSKEFGKAYPELFRKYSAPVSYKRFTVY
jgi:predicted phage-related endonuclease